MVRFMAGLGLGLGLNVDIQNGTIMTITEDPSPNLIGQQVDRSTSRQVDNSVLAVHIAYTSLIKFLCIFSSLNHEVGIWFQL